MNLFFLFTDFYFKLFLHCNPKLSYFFVLCFNKTQPFVKRKPVKTGGKKIPERSRSVFGRFCCNILREYFSSHKKAQLLKMQFPLHSLGKPGKKK